MWINAFANDNKVLSAIELLVLATVPGEITTPRAISEKLMNASEVWNPASGTIYPILHRLADRELLEKSKEKKTCFRRSEKGSLFLSSILKPLKMQMRETNLYYLAIIKSLLEIRPIPIGIREFIEELELLAKINLKNIQNLKKQSQELQDDAFDVPITFE